MIDLFFFIIYIWEKISLKNISSELGMDWLQIPSYNNVLNNIYLQTNWKHERKNVRPNKRIQCNRIRCSSYAGPSGGTVTPPDVKFKKNKKPAIKEKYIQLRQPQEGHYWSWHKCKSVLLIKNIIPIVKTRWWSVAAFLLTIKLHKLQFQK